MNQIRSVQFMTDDGETISIFIEEALSEIDEEGVVTLQLPVFADGRSGHIYLTNQECAVISRSPIIKEATRWALGNRMTRNSRKR